MIEEFERHLRGTNLSENTISSYLFALRQYCSQYDDITKKNLRAYKIWLIESYKPKTVNLRLRAINCYLESIGKENLKMPFVRVQQKAFLENVISEADYEYFKTCLKQDGELFWYFVIRFLAATGARVSELIQIKVEHIKLGHLDLYSKGGKLRRIYIPKALQNEALSWLNDKHGMLPVKRTIKNNKFLYRQPCYGWRYFMLLLYIAHDISLVSLHAVSFEVVGCCSNLCN